MSNTRILLTGGSGFIGAAVASAMSKAFPDLIIPFRTSCASSASSSLGSEQLKISDISGQTKWEGLLNGVYSIVHCAAVTSLDGGLHPEGKSALRAVNIDGTLNLARQAAAASVKRFIFISSIKVNGGATKYGSAFTADDIPKPIDEYGISKWKAEQGLMQLAAGTKMEVVIIRPPIVYGPNVKGNFAKLGTLIAKGVPLPLAMIKNKRSFMAIDNLVDLIITCITHPKAANQIFLASDAQDLSTPDLLNGMAKAMERNLKLFPFPSPLLNLGAAVIGKKNEADSLLGSLQLDISKTRDVLDWSPVIDVEEGLRRCFGKDRHS
jgi:nucleoside-diphosphate-sugar epimerase